MSPSFSNEIEVMVPAFGSAPFLFQTLDTARKNLPPTVRVTVVEDPSGADDIRRTVELFGDRFGYKRLPARLGISGVFNHCVDAATAKYLVLVGHDDVVGPDFEQVYLEALRRFDQPAIVIPRVRVIDGEDRPVSSVRERAKSVLRPKGASHLQGKRFVASLASGNWAYHPSIAWRVDVVREMRFDPELVVAQDFDLLVRMALAGHDVGTVDGIAIGYRRHNRAASSTVSSARRLREELGVQRCLASAASANGWQFLSVWSRMAVLARVSAAVPVR